MNTLTVSATHARNNFFELLDLVARGASVVVKKDQKVVAKVIPAATRVSKYTGLVKALKSAGKGFSYNEKDNPLRRKGAADFLGRWGQS